MYVERSQGKIVGATENPDSKSNEFIANDDPELVAFLKALEDDRNGIKTKAQKDQDIDNLFLDPRLGPLLDAIIEAAGLNKGQVIAAAKAKNP